MGRTFGRHINYQLITLYCPVEIRNCILLICDNVMPNVTATVRLLQNCDQEIE